MVSNGLDGLDKGLSGAAQRFIDVLTPVVEEVAGEVLNRKPSLLRDDVTVEAYNIAVAFIDADGRHTDPELRALVVAFGGLLPTQLSLATPAKIRDAGILRGKRAWLDEPSVLFDILVKADARLGTEHAKTYYERAMLIAHTVASLDDITSQAELNAIDHFRSLILGRIDNRRPAAVAGRGGASKSAAEGKADDDKPGPPAEEDLPPKRSVEELLAELDKLVGLDAVKAEVRLVADMLAVQRLRIERGIEVADTSRHLVFTGNPGTGKTTVARLLAEIYRSLEVVELGHLVETDRSGLVAGFVGQTAQRVVEVFDRADQGVLLIDEAYSLVRGGEKDFGREAIDTIVKLVEDRRDRVVCIAAGYPDEMADFIGANPGLKSRFPKTVHFPDYETDELVKIFELIANGNTYELDQDSRNAIRQWLDDQPRTKGFGNGRLARNLFEAMVAEQAGRVVAIDDPTDTELITLTADDLPAINALDPTATSSVADVEAEVAAQADNPPSTDAGTEDDSATDAEANDNAGTNNTGNTDSGPDAPDSTDDES